MWNENEDEEQQYQLPDFTSDSYWLQRYDPFIFKEEVYFASGHTLWKILLNTLDDGDISNAEELGSTAEVVFQF